MLPGSDDTVVLAVIVLVAYDAGAELCATPLNVCVIVAVIEGDAGLPVSPDRVIAVIL